MPDPVSETFRSDGALQTANDPVHYRKPEAAPRKLGGEEWVEQLCLSIRRHTGSGVGDFQTHVISIRQPLRGRFIPPQRDMLRAYPDDPVAISKSLRRIHDQIHHNLADLCRPGANRRETFGRIGDQVRVPGYRDLEQIKHAIHNLGTVDQLQDVALFSGIDHQLTDNLRAAEGGVPDGLQFFIGTCARLDLGYRQFGLSQHRSQQVVKVVGDAGGQRSQALQFLQGERFLLCAPGLGYIDTGSDVAGEFAVTILRRYSPSARRSRYSIWKLRRASNDA